MKLLAICSTNDFVNFTRRATFEAIWKQHAETDFLLYTGIKKLLRSKNVISGPRFFSFHFWVPEKYKRTKLSLLENRIRRGKWERFFELYDMIIFSDPNQYYLLNFISEKKKLIYILRDPNILLHKENKWKERRILSRNPHVFGISKNLCTTYLKQYYPDIEIDRITYWPNTVDLNIWNYEKIKALNNQQGISKIAGVLGNLTFKTDLVLLDFITNVHPEIQFEIFGENKLDPNQFAFFSEITNKKNVTYGGYLPLEKMSEEIIRWDVGLVIERQDMEFSQYYDANKRYQYMALGIPFVSYRYNEENDKFDKCAYLASSKEEYANKISEVFNDLRDDNIVDHCLEIASMNSSQVRAREFLENLFEGS